MPLFKSSPKSPQDLVKSLRDALQVLNTTEGGSKKSDKVETLSGHQAFTVSPYRLLKKLPSFWLP